MYDYWACRITRRIGWHRVSIDILITSRKTGVIVRIPQNTDVTIVIRISSRIGKRRRINGRKRFMRIVVIDLNNKSGRRMYGMIMMCSADHSYQLKSPTSRIDYSYSHSWSYYPYY